MFFVVIVADFIDRNNEINDGEKLIDMVVDWLINGFLRSEWTDGSGAG